MPEPGAKEELNVVVPEGAEDETIVVQKGAECESIVVVPEKGADDKIMKCKKALKVKQLLSC